MKNQQQLKNNNEIKKLSEQIIKTFKNSGFELSEPDVLLDPSLLLKDR